MAEFGALSSLGLGSSVLNYDIIDKLRKVDEDAHIKPLDKQIEDIKKREENILVKMCVRTVPPVHWATSTCFSDC